MVDMTQKEVDLVRALNEMSDAEFAAWLRESRPFDPDVNVARAYLLRNAVSNHVLHVKRDGDVELDGQRIGYVWRNARRLYEGFDDVGNRLFDNADCKATALFLLAERQDLLPKGSTVRITGLPSATGGPWTVA